MKNIFLLMAFVAACMNGYTQKDGIYRDLTLAKLEPEKVITLDLSYSNLTSLPEEVKEFKNMEGLFLQYNDLKTLPQWLRENKSLNRLVLDHNYQLDLRQTLKNIKGSTLTYLSAAGCNLPLIPAEISNFPAITNLNLADNSIAAIPAHIGKLNNLQQLDLSQNKLSKFSYELWNCSSLACIDLSGQEPYGADTLLAILASIPSLKEIKIPYFNSKLWSELNCKKLVWAGGKINTDFNPKQMKEESICLKDISIESCKNLFNTVAENKNIKKLSIENCSFAGELKEAAKCLSLEDLKFLNCTGVNLSPIGNLKQLKTLAVYGGNTGSDVMNGLKANLPNTIIATDIENKYPFSAGPVANIQVPVIKTIVNAQQPTVFKTENVKIDFPANSFVNSKGEVVEGDVEINYREFFDPVSIALSGIDMKTENLGPGNYMSSAGMFEISAKQNGQELQINPSGEVNVELSATQTGNNFGLFETDTTGKWQTLNKQVSFERKPGRVKYTFGPRPPSPPVYTIETGYASVGTGPEFSIKIRPFDNSSVEQKKKHNFTYPEIDLLSNYTFLYHGDSSDTKRKELDSITRIINGSSMAFFSNRYIPGMIEEYQLEPDFKNDCFNLQLKFRGKTYSYPVILPDNNYSNSWTQESNKKLYAKWTNLKRNPAEQQKQIAKYEKDYAKYQAALDKYYEETKALGIAPAWEMDNSAASQAVLTKFRLTKMTKYNIDEILSNKDASQLMVDYKTPDGTIQPISVILVDKSKNSAFTYSGRSPIVYVPGRNYEIIAVINDNLVGIAGAREIKMSEKSGVLELKLMDTKNKKINDLRAQL